MDQTERDAEGTRRLFADRIRGSSRRTTQPTYATDELKLDFVDAPVAEVVRMVIGSALGQPVSIATEVEGQITLSSPAAIPTADALAALEDVLNASGLTLVPGEVGFLLRPQQGTNRTAPPSGNAGVGAGAEIIRVQDTRPSSLARVIAPFVSAEIELVPEDTTGTLIVRGTRAERERLRDIIEYFDSPSIGDQVVGMFEMRFSDVQTVHSDLEAILIAHSEEAAARVQLVPLPRLNQLFVLATSDAQFNMIETWIGRLDRPSLGEEVRLYYYVVKHAPADRLALQVQDAIGVGSRLSVTTGTGEASDDIPTSSEVATSRPLDDSVRITPDELNNALIIRATGTAYRDIKTLLDRMDVPSPQVLIEATIAEVALTNDLEFGIRWFFESGEFDFSFPDRPNVTNDGEALVFPPIASRFSASYYDGVKAGVALDALSSITDVAVLSAPSIMVENNQEAFLQVGDQVPIVTQQSQSAASGDAPIISTIQLQDTGVILSVKPRINAADRIVLEIDQEVSEAVPTVTAGIDSPTIQQRQFSSTVSVRNGGTAVLGGFIRDAATDNSTGVPVLSRIPLLGNAFKATDQNRRRTELIVFLTPRIIRTDEEVEGVLGVYQSDFGRLRQFLERQEAIFGNDWTTDNGDEQSSER